MKLNYFLLLMSFYFLNESCSPFKMNLIKKGNQDEAIHNAILDFSNSSRLYKRDSVFLVSAYDKVCKMILVKLNDGNSTWNKGEIDEGKIAVSIIASYNKFLLTEDIGIGSKGILPSRYIEQDGKLFYWWDDDYPLTEEALTVFNKYSLLQNDEDGWIKFPEITVSEAKKGVDYYFCKNNLSKYKRVITNIGIGYYDPPKLNCTEK